MNAYQLLKVEEGATQSEVRNAYILRTRELESLKAKRSGALHDLKMAYDLLRNSAGTSGLALKIRFQEIAAA